MRDRRERLRGMNVRFAVLLDRMQEIGKSEPWWVFVASTHRDSYEQERLYQVGRSLIRGSDGSLRWIQTGKTVTRARPWDSAHCFGMAADIGIVDDRTSEYLPDDHPAWDVLEREALAVGLETGNRWKFRDANHVQIPGWKEACASEIDALRRKYE